MRPCLSDPRAPSSRQAKKDAKAARAASGEAEPPPDYDELDLAELTKHMKARSLPVPKDAKMKTLRTLLREDDERRKNMPPPPDYDAMDKDELKAQCKKYGISSDVKGPELRARLREDDAVRAKEAAAAAAAEAEKAEREAEADLARLKAASANKKAEAKSKSAAAAAGGGDEDEDEEDEEDEDEDEDEDSPKKQKAGGGKAAAGGKATPKHVAAAKAATKLAPVRAPAGKPDSSPPSNLIEVDFGEFSLIFNAHNAKCRTAWVDSLRKWSGWRKRRVDDELFAGSGGL